MRVTEECYQSLFEKNHKEVENVWKEFNGARSDRGDGTGLQGKLSALALCWQRQRRAAPLPVSWCVGFGGSLCRYGLLLENTHARGRDGFAEGASRGSEATA